MKFISYILLLFIITISNQAFAQESSSVAVGDMLKIGNSDNYQYSNVKFPRPNFIIKKGGIADYSKLEGVSVEVFEVETKKDITIVKLRRSDGKKFFGSFPSVKANYKAALSSGELSKN